ncbi:RNA-directed DNA polymerase, eukaryota [Tanacetum coccineum]
MAGFSVKLAWEALRPRGLEVLWFSTVWFPHGIPGHAFHLWLVMRRSLKKQDMLRHWDVEPNTNLSMLRRPLIKQIDPCSLGVDWNWNWNRNLESTGIFSVASARRRIDEICLSNIGEETRWVKCVPIKINVLAWKIKTDALPTRFNISRRGIDIQDMSCPICDNAIESTDHLFFRCGLVRDIANKVLSWWNLDHANLNSYAEWKSWLVSIRMDSKLKKMFEGVWYSIWWYVWIYRNKLLFDERKPSKSMLIDNVIASSFYWCKYRSKASFGWNEWLKNPYIIVL